MTRWISIAVSAAMLWLGVAAAQQSRQSPAKKSSATAKKAAAPAARTTVPAKKGTPATTAARHTGTASRSATASKKGTTKKPAATWRNRQTTPSADRYREIQSALASRGYLRAEEATGTWNQSSIDALKRFQQEQNLESTGKINSLSLIALGLGPKRDGAPVVVPAPQVPQAPEARPPSQ